MTLKNNMTSLPGSLIFMCVFFSNFYYNGVIFTAVDFFSKTYPNQAYYSISFFVSYTGISQGESKTNSAENKAQASSNEDTAANVKKGQNSKHLFVTFTFLCCLGRVASSCILPITVIIWSTQRINHWLIDSWFNSVCCYCEELLILHLNQWAEVLED